MNQQRNYFADKLVLITGATSGIGNNIATWFLDHGARVGIVGTNRDKLVEMERAYPGKALQYTCDLADWGQTEEMANQLLNYLGGLDILINCAGIIENNEITHTNTKVHDKLINLNLKAAFHVTQLCIDELIRSKGIIVNISCEWGSVPMPGVSSYCISKAGLESMTKNLALEYAEHGVRVNAVAPSAANPEMYVRSGSGMTMHEAKEELASMRDRNPSKRSVNLIEITKAVAFLCGPRSKKVTGQILPIDGGISISSNCHVDWAGQYYMDSKFAPKGNNTLPSFLKWVKEDIFDRINPPSKDERWMMNRHRSSNWATLHADAHVKITDTYDHMTKKENALAMHEINPEQQLFTANNPRPAERKAPTEPPQ